MAPFKGKYLGDGAYCDWDGMMLRIYTHNGIQETNTVYLGPQIQIALVHIFEEIVKGDPTDLSGVRRD